MRDEQNDSAGGTGGHSTAGGVTALSAIAIGLALAAPLHADPARFSLDAGGGLAAFPKFPGARAERVWPLPAIEADYGPLFLDTQHGRGLGLIFLRHRRIQLGTSLWFRNSRTHGDGATVTNLPDIKRAPRVELFATFAPGPYLLGATFSRDLGGSNGWTLDTNAAWRFSPVRRVHASLGMTATFASHKFMDTWFGVSSGESASSGLPEYSPAGGLESAGPTFTLRWRLGSTWYLNALASYSVLAHKPGDSPIVQRRAAPTLTIGLVHHFTF
jgi:outer membrane protein